MIDTGDVRKGSTLDIDGKLVKVIDIKGASLANVTCIDHARYSPMRTASISN